LRLLQRGHGIGMPKSRPMPSIGAGCHELRIVDNVAEKTWRIVYRLDKDAVLIIEVFAKKTKSTPKDVIGTCKRRIKLYEALRREV
jgi:phage-related protein